MPSKYPVNDERAYAFWKGRLEGKIAPHPEDPQPGRYRIPARATNQGGNVKDTSKLPKSYAVAIWPGPDLKLIVKIGFKTVLTEGSGEFAEFAMSTWPRCIPVSSEIYAAVADGGDWPNENAVVSNIQKMPAPQTFEEFEQAIQKLTEEAERMVEKGPASDKDTADMAGDLANMLSILVKAADKKRDEEKAPHAKAAKDVDDKWRPLSHERSAPSLAVADLKRKVSGPWLIAENKRLAAEAEAENKRRAEAIKQAEDKGEEPPAEIVNAPPPQRTATAGSRGRAVHVAKEKKAKIVDYDKALAYFKDNEEVKALIQSLANKLAKAGQKADGCEIYDDNNIR